MPELKLSQKDRLILSNQYRILEALYPDEAEQFARHREIVESGYELAFDWIAEHIDNDPMSEEACEEVRDILDMYRRMGGSFEQLQDKSGIDPKDLKFEGFDGNNETGHLNFHEFLAKQGKWAESPPLNSHGPMLEMYQRMLEVFRPLKRKVPLDNADIRAILAEKIHPDSRK